MVIPIHLFHAAGQLFNTFAFKQANAVLLWKASTALNSMIYW
jgi:hypothetical protein